MRTLVHALTLLGMTAAAAESITPVAPQFFALSAPDALKTAGWYQQAFGLEVLEEVRPPGDNGFVLILGSGALPLEIAQPKGSRSPGA